MGSGFATSLRRYGKANACSSGLQFSDNVPVWVGVSAQHGAACGHTLTHTGRPSCITIKTVYSNLGACSKTESGQPGPAVKTVICCMFRFRVMFKVRVRVNDQNDRFYNEAALARIRYRKSAVGWVIYVQRCWLSSIYRASINWTSKIVMDGWNVSTVA